MTSINFLKLKIAVCTGASNIGTIRLMNMPAGPNTETQNSGAFPYSRGL